MERPTFNFIHPDLPESDRELFFGPLGDDEEFILIEDGWLMAHIMHRVGIFPSVGQARKQGWDKPISEGFTMMTPTKRKIPVTILNYFEG